MKSNRWPIWLIAAVVALAGLSWALYVYADPEQRELDATVRARMPGQFAKLSDGYTHYELGGPAEGRVVVLAAGFSVPYYIWDPTFAALTAAGFRTLRYDYYGRGYSDRPAIPFNDDMYVRQLAELLYAAHITAPVDLAGISFGASLITSFADRHTDRVRSLIYFDPYRNLISAALGSSATGTGKGHLGGAVSYFQNSWTGQVVTGKDDGSGNACVGGHVQICGANVDVPVTPAGEQKRRCAIEDNADRGDNHDHAALRGRRMEEAPDRLGADRSDGNKEE